MLKKGKEEGKKAWTQEKLAEESGVGTSTVQRFIRQNRPIDRSSVRAICKALNLDLLDIVDPAEWEQRENFAIYKAVDVKDWQRVAEFINYNEQTWVERESLVSNFLSELQGQTRLLWITGISGIGKTAFGGRLASKAWESNPSFQWIYLEILEGKSPDFTSVAVDLLAQLGDCDLDLQERNNE